ncbi:PAS domain-containing protein, partial [Escherichia coli]|nr:PAS domain-containing protein [Escherichia coli]
ASLYRERNAILLSIKEGIIAIDHQGFITMMNTSAKNMLGLQTEYLHHHIMKLLPYTNMSEMLDKGNAVIYQKIIMKKKTFILNVRS